MTIDELDVELQGIVGDEYVSAWSFSKGLTIQLDGYFTLEQLEAIVVATKKYKESQ